MKGHWFCTNCNDVVNIRAPLGRWDARHGVQCPACQHHSADWKPEGATPVSDERAAFLFAALKLSIR